MDKIYAARFTRLIDHLRDGNFEGRMFNIGSWTSCAIGECPRIFGEWFFDCDMPRLRENQACFDAACEWFGLTAEDAHHLFLHRPSKNYPTRYDMANLLQKFVEEHSKEV